jgi:hypothetical protein
MQRECRLLTPPFTIKTVAERVAESRENRTRRTADHPCGCRPGTLPPAGLWRTGPLPPLGTEP